MSPKSLKTKTSTLTSMSGLLSTSDRDNSDVPPCLDHLYVPHGRHLGQGLQYLGKGVMIRAGRATTSYLRRATFGAQAVAIVSKIWKIWDGFHKELYLYGHPLHLRPLQGLCVPNIIGVFNTSEGLANMAMEPPHPHAWRVADRFLSTNEKRVIVEAYAQIHARGVLHRDVALRHMLIGRDGKATIINFRQASCLPPVKRIGLSGCGAHDFQLEMRQVKFLLDYEGAREFEYRLARNHCYAMRMSSIGGISSNAIFPISEITLRQWDASTLEDIHPPPLPSDVPNSPSISMHSISWISEEWPSNMDDFRYGDFVKNQPLIGPSPEVPLKQDCSDLEDDDDIQTQAPQPLRSPGRKRKFVESSCDLGVGGDVPSKRTRLISHTTHTTITTEEQSPEAHSPRAISVSGERVHHTTHSGCITMSCPSPEGSALSYPEAPPSVNTFASRYYSSGDASLQNQPPSSSLQRHEIGFYLPESLTTSLMGLLPAPPPNYTAHGARSPRPQSAGSEAPYEFGPYVDNVSDSSSDDSLASDDSSCGSWDYLEPLEPDLPTGAFVTLQDGLFQTPDIDISNSPLILDPSSDVEIDFTRRPQLEYSRLSFEPVFDQYKRKRLFIANESECDERSRKRRGIEQ
ncbi:hypothetical protein EDB92DRAFT_1840286 [Lactarius akahatsu]|uniref:Protein kinase domain-containing protein n=1 Tax=Lactarius akahatsu TaxID=416441 RepID=A0AAD4QGJ8_9AGAM|nr:hypothetical protein EDB92DRAFT_1840286 [Lactarius akahatsu]